MAKLGRTWRFENCFAYVRLTADLAYADEAGIRFDADDENVLRAIGDRLHVRETEMQSFDACDFHGFSI